MLLERGWMVYLPWMVSQMPIYRVKGQLQRPRELQFKKRRKSLLVSRVRADRILSNMKSMSNQTDMDSCSSKKAWDPTSWEMDPIDYGVNFGMIFKLWGRFDYCLSSRNGLWSSCLHTPFSLYFDIKWSDGLEIVGNLLQTWNRSSWKISPWFDL